MQIGNLYLILCRVRVYTYIPVIVAWSTCFKGVAQCICPIFIYHSQPVIGGGRLLFTMKMIAVSHAFLGSHHYTFFIKINAICTALYFKTIQVLLMSCYPVQFSCTICCSCSKGQETYRQRRITKCRI
ncbi:hypothetical protein D3C86_963700 [compost metagenome]